MKELKKIPITEFKHENLGKTFDLKSFTELDVQINILYELTNYDKIPSGNFYKFGCISDGKLYWYFNGKAVADSRERMLEIYVPIIQVTKETDDIPFIYKVKKK